MRKKLCWIVVVLLVITCIPAAAAEGVSESFLNSCSSSYKSGPYYAELASLALTDDVGQNVAAVAKTQVGYHAGANGNDLSGTSNSSSQFSEYARYQYKYDYNDNWCHSFAYWCGMAAGASEYVPYEVLILSDWKNKGAEIYSWKDFKNGFITPRAGDYIIYGDSTSGINGNAVTDSYCHIGVVSDYSNNTFYTVEGNFHNDVQIKSYVPDANTGYTIEIGYHVHAIVRPKYNQAGSFSYKQFAKCDLTVIPKGVVKVWSYPGSETTYPDSTVIYNIGGSFTATGIIENTASSSGHYWYQMKTPDGTTGYVWVENVSNATHRWSVSASGVEKPPNLSVGQAWPCTGIVTTGGSIITDVQGYIYAGDTITGTPIESSLIKQPNASSCDLNIIDSSMFFNNITTPGEYTYIVKVKLKSPIVSDGQISYSSSGWIALEDTRSHYYVTPQSAVDTTPPVISHVQVGDITPTSYTVSLVATDDGIMKYVKMPSWESGTSTAGIEWPVANQSDNSFLYTVNRSAGKYWTTDIYAFDSADNVSTVRVLVRDCLVTFDPTGGSVNEASKKVYSVLIRDVEQNIYGSLPTPTRTGFSFDGWYTAESGGNEVTGYSYVPHEDSKTLYARWISQTQTYTVTFDANGGAGAPAAQQIESGHLVTISDIIPERDGYQFLGWANSNTATEAEYFPGDFFKVESNRTLYAVWKEKNHSAWLESKPENVPDSYLETKIQYRYQDKETTSSTEASIEGWESTGTTTTAFGDYGAWSAWSLDAQSASETREVQSDKVYRYYYYYCPVCGHHEPFTGASDCKRYDLSQNDAHTGWFTTPYSQSNYKSFDYTSAKYYTNSLGDGQDWCFSAGNLNSTALGTRDTDSDAFVIMTGYRYRDRTATTLNVFERWTDWSDWSDTEIAATDTRRVESRIIYRYTYPTETILTLPSSLTRIESEAFAGNAAEAVIVPAGVQEIADGAIEAAFIIGEPDTEAEAYATRNGLAFIDVKDYGSCFVCLTNCP